MYTCSSKNKPTDWTAFTTVCDDNCDFTNISGIKNIESQNWEQRNTTFCGSRQLRRQLLYRFGLMGGSQSPTLRKHVPNWVCVFTSHWNEVTQVCSALLFSFTCLSLNKTNTGESMVLHKYNTALCDMCAFYSLSMLQHTSAYVKVMDACVC